MNNFVYILICSDNRYYVGSTSHLAKRLEDHQGGRIKFTSSRLPVKLAYKESYATLSDARKRERQIKNWKKRKDIERIVRDKLGPIV